MTTPSISDNGVSIECGLCGEPSLVNISGRPSDAVCAACGAVLWVDAISEVTKLHEFEPDIRMHQIYGLDRNFVMQQMINAIATKLNWTSQNRADFYAAIQNREQLGSTGIGNGFAIPHASKDWIESFCTVIAYVPQRIDFDSLDGQPVHTVVMVASPKSDPEGRLRTMERIARSIRSLVKPQSA